MAFEDSEDPLLAPVDTFLLDSMMNAAMITTASATLCAIAAAWLFIRCRASNFYRESTLCSRVYHKLLPLECCEPLLFKLTSVRRGTELDAPQAGGATEHEPERVDVLRLARENGTPSYKSSLPTLFSRVTRGFFLT